MEDALVERSVLPERPIGGLNLRTAAATTYTPATYTPATYTSASSIGTMGSNG